MAKITKIYNLPEHYDIRKDTDLDLTDPESINENIKVGIADWLYEIAIATGKISLDRSWETHTKQQLCDLLTALGTRPTPYSKYDMEDTKPLTIPLDDYVVNFLKVYACIRKITPSQALMKFYVYGKTFPERHGLAEPAKDPNKFDK